MPLSHTLNLTLTLNAANDYSDRFKNQFKENAKFLLSSA